MSQMEGETITQRVRRLYKDHKDKYRYSEVDVAKRALIATTTIWRVINETDDYELYRWDSILNILFAVGVDQEELRMLNRLYREALASGVPVKRDRATSVNLRAAATTDPFKLSPEARRVIAEAQRVESRLV